MGRSRRGSVSSSSQSDMSSSESDNEVLKRHMKIDEPVLYCEGCNFKSGSKFNLRYNTFGVTQNSIVFYGSFSVKKKRKIVPFKAIKEVEWCDDDSVKLIVPRENKDKPKTYNISFKKSHKGSPFRLIESRWNASKIDTTTTRLSSGEELYRNPSTQNLLRHFQNIPRDERLEFSYRCRIKGAIEQNYGVMFVTHTRVLFLSIDATLKAEEIKFEKILDISESLPKKGKLKKSILITVGKNQNYSFSSFENKEQTLEDLKRSLESFKKAQLQQQQQQKSINRQSTTISTTTNDASNTPKVYTPETPLPHGSKNSTWTSVKTPQPTTTSPLTPAPVPSSPKPTTTTTTTTTPAPLTTVKPPPTTPLLPNPTTTEKKENYGDRANKVFPKETPTELRQQEEIKQKSSSKDKSRRCCTLGF